MAKPTILPIWNTDETNSIEPDAAHKLDGWLAPGGIPEKPPFQSFNFWQNAVWKWLNEINIKGILGYDALTDYLANLSYVVGSDGNRYHCKINNGPTSSIADPVGDVTGTWVQILEDIIGKNAIINGSMLVAQRGASGSAAFTAATTPANNDDTYLLDRWILLSDGNNIVDVSQSTEAPTGALLSCALDVETINKKFGIFQILEQKNCAHMIGDNVSLSFWAKVSDITKLDNIKAMVVSWDGAADIVTSDIISAWNAEDTTPTLMANWIAENVPANLGVTATWARYIIPNIPIDTALAKNIGIFIWSDGFSDTLAKFLYIAKVQLEKNAIASEYEWRNITDELAKCQRYYCKSYDQNIIPGTISNNGFQSLNSNNHTNAARTVYNTWRYPVKMRSVPSIGVYSNQNGTAGKVFMQSGDVNAINVQIGEQATQIGGLETAAQTTIQLNYQATASAEL